MKKLLIIFTVVLGSCTTFENEGKITEITEFREGCIADVEFRASDIRTANQEQTTVSFKIPCDSYSAGDTLRIR